MHNASLEFHRGHRGCIGAVLAALACLAVLAPVALGATALPEQTVGLAEFCEMLDLRIPALLEEYRVPGAAAAIVCDGEVVWAKGYGFADVDRAKPVTRDTLFQVASLSKTVTAWGVLKLVEDEALELDQPVESYLTRWHIPESAYSSSGVTIRRLLSHTAGLSLRGYPGFPPGSRLPSLEESLSGATGGSGDVRIVQQPGLEYSYSGGGYTLLQLVIEEVTGEDFATYMKHEILDPLGMTQSSFEYSSAMRSTLAVAYDSNMRLVPNYVFTATAAAGLYSSVAEYALFIAACADRAPAASAGRGVLSSDMVNLMTSPHPESGGSYGLGYGIGWTGDGESYVRHSGGNAGWRSLYAAFPEDGGGIVILSNGNNGDEIAYWVFDEWLNWFQYSKSCGEYSHVEGTGDDRDGDGVPDEEDMCPDWPGTPEMGGC